jgi:dTDP-4-amino-4,6-dideoxygalactose transaminase
MKMEDNTNRQKPRETRRAFLKTTGAGAAGLCLAGQSSARAAKKVEAGNETLALNGGPKAVTHPQKDAHHWPRYGPEEEKAVAQLLRTFSYAPNDALEKDWKEKFQVPYARAYCNGTSAMMTIFFSLAQDFPPGSEIMTPSYTAWSIGSMGLFGLVPVFVDINPRTLNFDLDDAKRRLTKNTKAVMPVHWFGLPCDMDQICDWAKEKGLIVLEDACHAHGASLQGKYMGSWGRMAAFSFQASKVLPAIEGGMGVYQQREDFERGTTLGDYTKPNTLPADSSYRKYQGSGFGPKLRMHPIAAVLARCQLRGLDKMNSVLAAQVRRLNDRIVQLPGLYEQPARPDMKRVYYASDMLFIDEAKAGMSREACVKALQAEGVSCSAYTYVLQHRLAFYAEERWWRHKPVIPELPGSEQANRTTIALPLITAEIPELADQYAAAFEKVWAHRKELGKS